MRLARYTGACRRPVTPYFDLFLYQHHTYVQTNMYVYALPPRETGAQWYYYKFQGNLHGTPETR